MWSNEVKLLFLKQIVLGEQKKDNNNKSIVPVIIR